eukprot:CAMPEP_0179071602 /NCGR_PEP_ID=MMETSP0796-20121207/31617_1 /TAXON_ID=73915 /ORGANISM="Pyrodinium bahamense, Strain pbaha01" /LENGTH=187 /DNA_ID=CAMNT_0020768723 /DNA_START=197 /DNA_END=761 /DNA_ORIENTATION=-
MDVCPLLDGMPQPLNFWPRLLAAFQVFTGPFSSVLRGELGCNPLALADDLTPEHSIGPQSRDECSYAVCSIRATHCDDGFSDAAGQLAVIHAEGLCEARCCLVLQSAFAASFPLLVLVQWVPAHHLHIAVIKNDNLTVSGLGPSLQPSTGPDSHPSQNATGVQVRGTAFVAAASWRAKGMASKQQRR